MKISNLKKECRRDEIILSADITRANDSSVSIYFELPKKFEQLVAHDGSVYLAATLSSSMALGEPLHLDASMSQKLLANLESLQDIFSSWKIGMKNVPIVPTDQKVDTPSGRAVGCFFSGGVDSFYALLRNRKEDEQKFTHLIFVHGFDIDHANIELYEKCLQTVTAIADHYGLTVIPVRTNMRTVIDNWVSWGYSHGGALAAVALLLRSGFSSITIPSTNSREQLGPRGSHPDTDPLWSTESLSIVHDNYTLTRVQKIKQYIAHSPLAVSRLRVCYKNPHNAYNCGRCEKCTRTMIELTAAGVDLSHTAFPGVLSNAAIRSAFIRDPFASLYAQAVVDELEATNTLPEFRKRLERLLVSSRPALTDRIRSFVSELDIKYNRNRIYKFLSKRGLT